MKKKTLDGVDKAIASAMIKRYAAKHKGENGVIKSVWFSIDQLDKMITMLKAERLMAGEDENRYGIRFYMGTYDKIVLHTNINGTQRDYGNKDTVLMVSTKQGEKDGEPAKINVDYFSKYVTNLKTVPIENHGELCPEDCSGTDPDFQ